MGLFFDRPLAPFDQAGCADLNLRALDTLWNPETGYDVPTGLDFDMAFTVPDLGPDRLNYVNNHDAIRALDGTPLPSFAGFPIIITP